MTESMNLDSADIVSSLEEFESLDTSLEAELNMLSEEQHLKHTSMDLMPSVLSKNSMEVMKEEIIEKMEPEEQIEEQLMEETIPYDNTVNIIDSVMDIVESEGSYHGQELVRLSEDDQNHSDNEPLEIDHGESTMHNDHEIFSDRVIDEVIVGDEQVIEAHESRDYDDNEADISDMISDNVTEETVIEGSEVMEFVKQDIIEKKEPEKVVTSNVFVVNTHPGTLQTAQAILSNNTLIAPKENKVARLIVPTSNSDTGQTIRIVSPGKLMGATAKTITLAQAKQMGLINLNQIYPPNSKGNVGKLVVPKKTVTVMKSPTKILPAPPTLGKTQKVVIRGAGGSLKAGTILTSPGAGVLRIPGAQAAQLHIPTGNKQVQYLKLVGSSKPGTTLVPVSALSKTIPVALQTSLLNSSPATFKVLPITTQATGGQPQTSQTVVSGTTQRVLIPANTAQINNTLVQPTTPRPSQHSILMLQPHVLPQVSKQEKIPPTQSSTIRTTANGKRAAVPTTKVKEEIVPKVEVKTEIDEAVMEANGIRPRKPCNCTKSMCLKLYCDCFANGEFCHQCNCTTCFNNLSHEEERQRAIKSCLERNPTAFRPKIGKTYVGSEERRHNKGCNCRRSGCLKNYCECYEAKIPCSKNCKCVGCKNTEGYMRRGLGDDDKFGIREKADTASARSACDPHITGHRQVLNLMSPQLVEATCQCLVAQVEEWSRGGSNDLDLAQALVIEELGRCLAQLIDCINKSLAQIPQSAS